MPDQLLSSDVIKQLKELRDTSRQFRDLTQPRPGTIAGYARGYTANGKPHKRGNPFRNKSTKKFSKGGKQSKIKGEIDEVCVHSNSPSAQLLVCAPTSQSVAVPASDMCQNDQNSNVFNLKNIVDNFKGGKLVKNLDEWIKLTSDNWILTDSGVFNRIFRNAAPT